MDRAISALIQEFDEVVASLTESSRQGTLEQTAKRVKELRVKIACYGTYLGATRTNLKAQVAVIDQKLKATIMVLAE